MQAPDDMAARLRPFGTTIFAEMSALAREHGAVNLGQGFPDFDGPPILIEEANRAMRDGRNQYAISTGEPTLRRAIAEHAARFYDMSVDPDAEVTVTSGATEAILCAALGLIDPGDEVIVFEPCYDSYVPVITMASGVAVPVTLHAPTFRFDADELRAAFTARTKLLILNTPHNPSGTVFTREELELIASLCIEHDVIAVVDEVYEHIVFESARHIRLATLPGMWERTLTISSAGKSFSMTGWKIGWMIGPAALQLGIRRVHQFSVFATSTPLQYGVAAALALEDDYFQGLALDYRTRRDFLFDVLGRAGLRPHLPEGSYFILCDIAGQGQEDGAAFSRWLVTEIGVACIPPASFYLRPERGADLVRFCFCKKWETLERAAELLSAIRARTGGDDRDYDSTRAAPSPTP